MPTGLRRYQQAGDMHHITVSCVRHRPILGTPEARDTFVELLERTRELYAMHIFGYVVMPPMFTCWWMSRRRLRYRSRYRF
jgi:putative transposase